MEPAPVPNPASERQPFPLTNLVLFLLTVVSTIMAGIDPTAKTEAEQLQAGVIYSAALMAILICHEMGHYLAARLHQVDVSLPYFIPLPAGGLIGTLGALINIRSKPPSFKAVLDIGVAGPLAGFLVALPLLILGTIDSTVVSGAQPLSANADWTSPFSLLSGLVHHRVHSWPIKTNTLFYGDSILTWLVTRLVHGPLPPGSEVFFGPVARAAWVGMLVTAMNLTPIGQLDGGHVVYALLGRWGPRASQLFSYALLGMGLFASWNWLVWWALTRVLVGLGGPEPAQREPLTPARRRLAIASLMILAVTFVPVPITG